MTDKNWESQQAGRSSGGMYDPSRHDWNEFQIGRMNAQQSQQTSKPTNAGPKSGGMGQSNTGGGGGGGLILMGLIFLGLAVVIVAGVLSALGALVMKLMARLSGRGSMTYGESYVASFYTLFFYGMALALLYGVIALYCGILNPNFATGAIWYLPLRWRWWQVIIGLQPLAIAAGGWGLMWRGSDRYEGFGGYVRACISAVVLILLTLIIAGILSVGGYIGYMLATRGIHDPNW